MENPIKIISSCLLIMVIVLCFKFFTLDKKTRIVTSTVAPFVQQETASGSIIVNKNNKALELNALRSLSQQDTQVDGGLRESADGQLIVERRVRDVFDYFMTAAGELPLSQIVSNMHQFIDASLSLAAAQQAKELLQNYLDLETALDQYHNSLTVHPRDLEGLSQIAYWRDIIDKRVNLRQQYLGSASKAFFAEEEAYDYFTIERMQIELLSLDSAQKEQQVEQLMAQLPPVLQSVVRMQQQTQTLEHQEAVWAQMSDQVRFVAREARYGSEAAKRLAILDVKRTQWDQRIKLYLEKKAVLQKKMGEESQETARAVKELQHYFFDHRERLRLDAYER